MTDRDVELAALNQAIRDLERIELRPAGPAGIAGWLMWLLDGRVYRRRSRTPRA